jgi:hypothetical protein
VALERKSLSLERKGHDRIETGGWIFRKNAYYSSSKKLSEKDLIQRYKAFEMKAKRNCKRGCY